MSLQFGAPPRMAQRTNLFQQLPWVGGLNSSLDESMIPPNQCTVLDNVVFDTRGSKKKRQGINHDWDDASSGSDTIIDLNDFWFGTNSRTQRLVGVSSARNLYSYTSGGTRSTLTVGGKAWTSTLDSANQLTFNNKNFIAVSGSGNLLKQWDGSSSVTDVKSAWNQQLATSGRSSAGTTRTLKLTTSFFGVSGSTIVVEDADGGNAAFYNGTYVVTGVTTGSITNDTITYTATGSLTESVSDSTLRVHGIAPQCSIMREHLGRIWTNDKTNIDRIHFSGARNHEEWLGFGDSGAMDIGVGDGDPEGITAIFPSFKGELFVAKRTKLYRISGYTPETFQVTLVSSGIGCVSHASAVAVDQDDVYFCSEKGIHSVQATAAYGDFAAAFISADIQRTFNEDFSHSRRKYIKAGYLPGLNSVAFAVTEEELGSTNNSLYLYNVPLKCWYRWPNISCEALCVANDADMKRLYLGTTVTRVSQTFNGLNYDVTAAGANSAIRYRIETGLMFVDQNPYTLKAYKRFILYYRPKGRHTVTATIRVDNTPLSPENSLAFSQTTTGTPLGAGFVLGSTPLGSSFVFGPQIRHIDGVGRGIKLSIEQSGTDEEVELQGFGIESEPSGTNSEVY